ncbi:MAG: hypothetical protein HQ567_29370 [Candidatus Nealsonbacteria bacterium]|nr:hypothetical protein [Candidatus Nealsonbacteria bacterium]
MAVGAVQFGYEPAFAGEACASKLDCGPETTGQIDIPSIIDSDIRSPVTPFAAVPDCPLKLAIRIQFGDKNVLRWFFVNGRLYRADKSRAPESSRTREPAGDVGIACRVNSERFGKDISIIPGMRVKQPRPKKGLLCRIFGNEPIRIVAAVGQ